MAKISLEGFRKFHTITYMRLFGVVVEELEEVFVSLQKLSLSVHTGLELGC